MLDATPTDRLKPIVVSLCALLGVITVLTGWLYWTPTALADSSTSWSVDTVDGEQGSGRANFNYQLEAESQVSDALRVANTGTKALTLDIYAADAFTTNSGSIDILPKGEQSVDAGSWITVQTPTITLDPGQSQDVAFTITVPDNATPGDHSAAIVASVGENSTSQVEVERRLGLRVSIRVPGEIKAQLTIDDISARYQPTFNPFRPAKIQASYTITNSGNIRVQADDALAVDGLLNLTKPARSVVAEDLLPGSKTTISREIPTFAFGKSIFIAELTAYPLDADNASPNISFAKVEVNGLPWATLALALLVIAGATAAIIALVRRRRETLLLLAEIRANQQGDPILLEENSESVLKEKHE